MKMTADQAKIVTDLMNAPALTVSGLIRALEQIESEHGDLPVLLHDDSAVREACAYDKDGDSRGKRVEVVLHGVR